jgi:hypothetical protein
MHCRLLSPVARLGLAGSGSDGLSEVGLVRAGPVHESSPRRLRVSYRGLPEVSIAGMLLAFEPIL